MRHMNAAAAFELTFNAYEYTQELLTHTPKHPRLILLIKLVHLTRAYILGSAMHLPKIKETNECMCHLSNYELPLDFSTSNIMLLKLAIFITFIS